MSATADREIQIDREYPYRYGRGWNIVLGGVLICGMTGGLGLLLLYLAIFDSSPFQARGIRLEGAAATLADLVCAAVLFVATAFCFAFQKKAYLARNQRIALTSTGILLPRDRFATVEEDLKYEDILDIQFEQMSYWFGIIKEVTFMHIATTAGWYSVARQKLTRRDFDDLSKELIRRAQRAHEKSPARGAHRPTI